MTSGKSLAETVGRPKMQQTSHHHKDRLSSILPLLANARALTNLFQSSLPTYVLPAESSFQAAGHAHRTRKAFRQTHPAYVRSGNFPHSPPSDEVLGRVCTPRTLSICNIPMSDIKAITPAYPGLLMAIWRVVIKMLCIHKSDKPKGVADGDSNSFHAIWCTPPLSSSLQAAGGLALQIPFCHDSYQDLLPSPFSLLLSP